MKHWIIAFTTLLLLSCGSRSEENKDLPNYYQIAGEAQGTTYAILFEECSISPVEVKTAIDSLLNDYDLQNSVYKEGSTIRQINASEDSINDLTSLGHFDHFVTCFNVSKEVHQFTEGAFNPTVYPLVEYWGFYHDQDFVFTPDSMEVQGFIDLVDFSDYQVHISEDVLVKPNPKTKIDFNAIAQGHSVDVVGDFLESLGVANYMVEIGGEITCKGKNPDGNLWTVGIDKPVEGSEPGENGFQFIAAFSDLSLATSGSYRKYYSVGGQKYSHTIDPISGYPARQNLLSVTVITNECIYADAYATAFMVMGVEDAIAFIDDYPELNLHAYFVYDEAGEFKTKMTEGFEDFILQ